MSLDFLYPEFEVIRNSRCVNCRVCERECANGVHHFDVKSMTMVADEEKCVN